MLCWKYNTQGPTSTKDREWSKFQRIKMARNAFMHYCNLMPWWNSLIKITYFLPGKLVFLNKNAKKGSNLKSFEQIFLQLMKERSHLKALFVIPNLQKIEYTHCFSSLRKEAIKMQRLWYWIYKNLNKQIVSVHEGKRPFRCRICENYFKIHKHLLTDFALFNEKLSNAAFLEIDLIVYPYFKSIGFGIGLRPIVSQTYCLV